MPAAISKAGPLGMYLADLPTPSRPGNQEKCNNDLRAVREGTEADVLRVTRTEQAGTARRLYAVAEGGALRPYTIPPTPPRRRFYLKEKDVSGHKQTMPRWLTVEERERWAYVEGLDAHAEILALVLAREQQQDALEGVQP